MSRDATHLDNQNRCKPGAKLGPIDPRPADDPEPLKTAIPRQDTPKAARSLSIYRDESTPADGRRNQQTAPIPPQIP